MKEATGELNMTVITIVAIAAIAAVFYAWVWPSIQQSIRNNTCNAECGVKSGATGTLKSSSGGESVSCSCPSTTP